jgi:hypothetical protein
MFPTKISATFFYSFWFEFQFVFKELIPLFKGGGKDNVALLISQFLLPFLSTFYSENHPHLKSSFYLNGRQRYEWNFSHQMFFS